MNTKPLFPARLDFLLPAKEETNRHSFLKAREAIMRDLKFCCFFETKYSVYQWYLFLMVAVLEVFAICGQLEVVHGRIGLFVDRILCHCICSMLLTAPLRHIFASTKFPQKGRYIVVGGNNKDRYAVFFVFFV